MWLRDLSLLQNKPRKTRGFRQPGVRLEQSLSFSITWCIINFHYIKGGFIMRFTKDAIQRMLDANEGYMTQTYLRSKNVNEEVFYHITDGKLVKRSIDKSSRSHSRYDKTSVCDIDQTRRFLIERMNVLKFEA